jgi:hypothetical protein
MLAGKAVNPDDAANTNLILLDPNQQANCGVSSGGLTENPHANEPTWTKRFSLNYHGTGARTKMENSN